MQPGLLHILRAPKLGFLHLWQIQSADPPAAPPLPTASVTCRVLDLSNSSMAHVFSVEYGPDSVAAGNKVPSYYHSFIEQESGPAANYWKRAVGISTSD